MLAYGVLVLLAWLQAACGGVWGLQSVQWVLAGAVIIALHRGWRSGIAAGCIAGFLVMTYQPSHAWWTWCSYVLVVSGIGWGSYRLYGTQPFTQAVTAAVAVLVLLVLESVTLLREPSHRMTLVLWWSVAWPACIATALAAPVLGWCLRGAGV